jgi:hypothetical protein
MPILTKNRTGFFTNRLQDSQMIGVLGMNENLLLWSVVYGEIVRHLANASWQREIRCLRRVGKQL